ncbi:RecBCD enzyme subunit RecC [Bacterioplanes sanyensis]|uniref:exodeoxyribonuclease V subunit gamma n=1 Tax=Bacterioplanes sanyensis TaxID=1249553 RepID=UPI00167AF4ED|nr:exodeoxyribonuclease V subunit gamma [Bacterioplanes sanyensis]GGY44180.1 RecBCD enzyme subunit RecC [Bacterioplanes sanyensis]
MFDHSHITPGFHVIHANHLEDLRQAVVHLCRQSPMPPLHNETFLVQSNGIAQWLKLALAENTEESARGGLGIAAGMEFLFPARFIWQAYRAVLPVGEVPEQSPFDKPRLVWRLFRLLPSLLDQDDAFKPLARFVDGPEPQLRTFQLAEKIADLFDQYQVFRADWLAAWEQARDVLISARGEERKLPEDQRWQSLLWRALVEDVGRAGRTSRAHIHTRFMQQGRVMQQPADASRLPRRIVVFGVSSLPRQALEALSVLSRFSQIVLCVHNPCQYFWADIISDRELLKAERKRGLTHPVLGALGEDDALHQHANPLLAAWGKQGRDYIRLLDEFDEPESYQSTLPIPEHKIDIFRPHGKEDVPQLLHQLQNDILELTPLAEIRAQQRRWHGEQDQSLVLHSAHSAQREVEILHDQLLAAFNADATLRPRDVIVMVPDINAYAAAIEAVFGQHAPGSMRHIPFTISDQGQRHHQPLLIALEALLSLPRHRFAASDMISLLEVPALRQRFDIEEDELPLLRRWVAGAQIRWGLSADQRQQLELPAGLARNTWHSGLRSMLLGYGLGDDDSWAGIEPYSEVAGLQASLAGRLDAFVQALQHAWQQLQQQLTPPQWHQCLAQLVQDFFLAVELEDQRLVGRFLQQLEQWLQDCDSAALSEQALPLDVVKDVLLDGLDEGGLNQRFLAGKVNFATLMPMRAIPFRRVCLLGMNDGDYPRSRPPVDFDLMAQDYRPGDRSRREDDRYLFLEAMLSAREQLYISWVGRSIRDDSERPPSVLLAQLLDHLDSHWQPDGQSEQGAELLSQQLIQQHPLQPFSRDYFPVANADLSAQPNPAATVLAQRRLFTYQHEWRAAHGYQASTEAAPALPKLERQEPLSLGELANFLKRPIESFFQHRLQVRFAGVEVDESDVETFALNGLQRWQLDQQLIEQVIVKAADGADFEQRLEHCLQRMAGRGQLGMGSTEPQLREQLAARMPNIFGRYRQLCEQYPHLEESRTVTWPPSAGTEVELADVITGVRYNDQGQRCRVVIARGSLLSGTGSNAKVRYGNLLHDWLVHLLCQLQGEVTSCIIGKEEDRNIQLPPLPLKWVNSYLRQLLDGFAMGLSRPLPVHSDAAFAWINSYHKKGKYQRNSERALEQAQAVYDMALQRDLGYLRASYPQALPEAEFAELAETLYLPLWQLEQGLQPGPVTPLTMPLSGQENDA